MSSRLLLVALVATMSSGCGWLASSRPVVPDDDRPRLSHQALVAAAEDACKERARVVAALPRPDTKQQRQKLFARVAEIERNEYAALSSLRPPREDEIQFARLLAASRNLAELATSFQRAFLRKDAGERRQIVAQVDHASARYDRAARALGLSCRQAA